MKFTDDYVSIDERVEGYCIYCGKEPETKDHVPSKVLLDEPFPEQLPIVPSCKACNQGFSLDEEYFACLIECVINGSTNPDELKRPKIIRIIKKRSELQSRIEEAKVIIDKKNYFKTEPERIQNVILKLARGHAYFENGEPLLCIPKSISITPKISMSENQLQSFLTNDVVLFPEVGSRMLERMFSRADMILDNWIVVQEGNYMYSVGHLGKGFTVKMLIFEYLACEVIWD